MAKKIDKKFDEAIKAAYKLGKMNGLEEGERRSKRLLNCMRIVNKHLLEIANILDEDLPITGINISMINAREIVKYLAIGKQNAHLAGRIRKMIVDKKGEELHVNMARLKRDLEEMVELKKN